MPSSALAIAISRALTRPSRARRARRRSSSEPMSSRIANADIVGSLPPDHNICYSQPAFDATLLASQHQLRSVLLTRGSLPRGGETLSWPLLKAQPREGPKVIDRDFGIPAASGRPSPAVPGNSLLTAITRAFDHPAAPHPSGYLCR